jgi:hypothetical protein
MEPIRSIIPYFKFLNRNSHIRVMHFTLIRTLL